MVYTELEEEVVRGKGGAARVDGACVVDKTE